MTSNDRVETALKGGKPDRVPIVPIYDEGYVMSALGYDLRLFLTASSVQRVSYIEQILQAHEVDGMMVHSGRNDDFVKTHRIDKHEDYWMVTNEETKQKYRLMRDGNRGKYKNFIVDYVDFLVVALKEAEDGLAEQAKAAEAAAAEAGLENAPANDVAKSVAEMRPEILAKVHERAFGKWSDRDWDRFTKAWLSHAK